MPLKPFVCTSKCPIHSDAASTLIPSSTRSSHRWNNLDVVMILLSLLALMLNTSGVSVVRLIRVFRVCAYHIDTNTPARAHTRARTHT